MAKICWGTPEILSSPSVCDGSKLPVFNQLPNTEAMLVKLQLEVYVICFLNPKLFS